MTPFVDLLWAEIFTQKIAMNYPYSALCSHTVLNINMRWLVGAAMMAQLRQLQPLTSTAGVVVDESFALERD